MGSPALTLTTGGPSNNGIYAFGYRNDWEASGISGYYGNGATSGSTTGSVVSSWTDNYYAGTIVVTMLHRYFRFSVRMALPCQA